MRATIDATAVGRRIRRLRVATGMSQEELAAPRYTAAYISHLENGRRSASNDALAHVASKLAVEADQLLTGRDPDLDVQLQLAIDQAIARMHVGELDEARDKLETTLRRARKENLTRAQAGAEEGLGLIAQREARWVEALRHHAEAENLLVRSGAPPEARTSVVTARARCLFANNHLSHAIHVLETHLVELNEEGPGDPTALLQTYSALIGPYFEAGFREKAAETAEEAYKLESRVQDPEHVACLHINRAQILLEKGHRDEATRSLARAEDLFKQIGWRDSAAKAAVARATAAVENGDLEAGEELVKMALSELEQTPNVLERARTLNLLARIERLRDRPQQALVHLDEVGALLVDQHSLEQGWRLREAALCHIELGRPAQAEELLRGAVAIYIAAEAPNQVATTAAYLGDVLVQLGHTEEAAEVYRSGLAAVEDLAV